MTVISYMCSHSCRRGCQFTPMASPTTTNRHWRQSGWCVLPMDAMAERLKWGSNSWVQPGFIFMQLHLTDLHNPAVNTVIWLDAVVVVRRAAQEKHCCLCCREGTKAVQTITILMQPDTGTKMFDAVRYFYKWTFQSSECWVAAWWGLESHWTLQEKSIFPKFTSKLISPHGRIIQQRDLTNFPCTIHYQLTQSGSLC